MCGGETSPRTYMISVSSGGTGVRVIEDNQEWEVTIPSVYNGMGPCAVRVFNARVKANLHHVSAGTLAAARLASDLPIQGNDLTVTQGFAFANYSNLASIDFGVDAGGPNIGPKSYFQPGAQETPAMRCMGVPTTLRFKIQRTAFDENGWIDAEIPDADVCFELQLIFDDQEECHHNKRKR
jgi:hypothetical protein